MNVNVGPPGLTLFLSPSNHQLERYERVLSGHSFGQSQAVSHSVCKSISHSESINQLISQSITYELILSVNLLVISSISNWQSILLMIQ